MSLNKDTLNLPTKIVLSMLRMVVGWHFLYEGLAKFFNPNWTAAGYLSESSWLLSDFFHWIVANKSVMAAVDAINIWGLMLIGVGLFLGVFTRLSSFSGIVLLALYYIANPPLLGFPSEFSAEGSYLIINKNIIEMGILLLFLILPKGSMWGIDRILKLFSKSRSRDITASRDNSVPLEENTIDRSFTGFMNRRELIKNLAAVPFFGVFVVGVLRKKSYEEKKLQDLKNINAVTSASMKAINFAGLKDLKEPMKMAKIKDAEISRLICGGNLISSFAHSRDLIYVSPLLKRYFNDEKVIETLRLCEASGVNTAVLRTDDHTIRILNNYRKRGGKIQWLAQTYPKEDDLYGNIQKAIDNGAMGAFVMGGIADKFVKSNQPELIGKAVEYIKSRGVIAGCAGHSLHVPMTCERGGIDVDFYMKTFHRDDYWSAHPKEHRVEFSVDGKKMPGHNQYHDNIWCLNPEETAEFMKTVQKPWIAYKVFAAGAIRPEQALQYVFEKGADFACVGMFDFQVVENVNIANQALQENLERERKWFA